MEIKLIVIRSSNQKELVDFFCLLGLRFDYHKHGNSPYHYSTTIGGLVLEIYPLANNQQETDPYLRLGFTLDNFEETLEQFKKNNVVFTEPIQTDFGFLTVATDPDGRKIELYKG